ncbi:hypothetical protein CY35_04G138700 [Sphagnum magellanicum]|nr:hypothetical protein CY35_04G138700 [Sphagnum magellanicum]KAH9566646.1 hypothetical protein CY35_04G138700 [Sphagnum magellanicum]
MNRVEPMGDATLDFASKGQEQRSFSSFALSPQDGSADLPLRRSDSLLSEKPTTTLRSSSRSLQRQNSERLQRSSSPQPNISSPKARNLQGAAFRTQALSATTASESLLRTLSSVPSSPKSVLPEVALPESSRFTPRARSLASSSGLLSSPRRAVFTRSATFSGRRKRQLWKNGGLLPLMFVLLWFALDWWFLSQFQEVSHQSAQTMSIFQGSFGKSERPSGHVYERLLSLAAHALAEGELQTESEDLWQEPFKAAAAWKPCADQRTQGYLAPPLLKKSSGYLMISANGGLNQQRIAVCNAVALARLLNATLVLPRFLFNSVWRDSSQFGDIYQEDFFVEYLRADVQIVKDLPIELQSLDLEATGSLVTDMEVPKEATPTFYLINILPLLLRTGVVHLLGFGNRLAFDPIPFDIQRLRCRCNFHALKFLPKLEQIGVLIANRMRERSSRWGPLDDEFHPDGNGFMSVSKQSGKLAWKTPKYLALHLRFEMDMVAHSMCEFGGGEAELEELRAYRAIHFPTLSQFEQHDWNQLCSIENLDTAL